MALFALDPTTCGSGVRATDPTTCPVPPPRPPLFINQGPVLGGPATHRPYDPRFDDREVFATVDTALVLAMVETADVAAAVSTAEVHAHATTSTIEVEVTSGHND